MNDVRDAVEFLLKFHNNFAILQCTSGYPAEFNELNLNCIKTYMEAFPNQIIGGIDIKNYQIEFSRYGFIIISDIREDIKDLDKILEFKKIL